MSGESKITIKKEGIEQLIKLKRENIVLGGGGHEFVIELPLPKEAKAGVEYVLMDDLSDSSTYKGTYIFNPDTDSYVASSSGSGGSIVVDNALSTVSTNPVQNKVITTELEKKASTEDIPDVSNFATKDDLDGKQDELKSGENIKTINGQSILGEGNIKIEGGGGDGALSADLTVSNPLGKYTADEVIAEGTSFETIFRGILSKTYYPTLTPPSATLTYSTNALMKVGTSIAAKTATVALNRGSINPAYGTSGYRSGAATGFALVSTGATNNINENNTTGSFNVPALTRNTKGNIVLTGTASYAAGEQPKDSDGANYSTPLAAGSVSASRTIEFILPFYYGVSNTAEVSSLDGLTEDLTKKGQKTYTFKTNNQHMVIVYDASYGNLTSILDPNNFETIGAWSKSALTVDGQNYTVYVAKTASTAAGAKYTFKF